MAAWNWKTCTALAACGMAAAALSRKLREESLTGQTVLITGGSRGLGLLLAREFAREGCRLAVCARDHDELASARDDLASLGATVYAAPCDVASPQQVENFVAAAEERLGPIDVLINNAGIIQVGPLEAASLADFDEALDVMYRGQLHFTLAVLPGMRRRRTGRIVNITSIGGQIPVPHLLPYSCAKSAAVALSLGLRAELQGTGIRVSTVVPSVMRIGSHLNAEFYGHADREYRWFALGASLPLLSVEGERAARSIAAAIRRGAAVHYVGLAAAVASRLHAVFPVVSVEAASLINRWLLPEPAGQNDSHSPRIKGHLARRQLDSPLINVLTLAGRRAAENSGQFR